MKKNQKYTQEEITLAIDMWKESGLTKAQFCKRENISRNTFKYWQSRYRQVQVPIKKHKGFIPLEVTEPTQPDFIVDSACITISYPNGVQVQCPMNINDKQLKSLISH